MDINILIISAASIGFFHTLLGPDHYIPFAAMAKSLQWNIRKTLAITFLCGLGHIAGSVILGFLGIFLGLGVSKLDIIDQSRGKIAGWLLFSIGIIYMVWGMKKAITNKRYNNKHTNNTIQTRNRNSLETRHKHSQLKTKTKVLTPWTLFVIFLFGSCKPLIPILMYPASKSNLQGIIVISSAFFSATLLTMIAIVSILYYGLHFIHIKKYERHIHTISGASIALSGAFILLLDLEDFLYSHICKNLTYIIDYAG